MIASLRLLVSVPDPKQQIRLSRFLMALKTYAVGSMLLSLAVLVGLMEVRGYLQTLALIVMANAGLFWMIRSGWSLRLSDPSLTVPQMVCANLLLMHAGYFSGQARGLFLLLLLVILLFGVLKLTKRQFMGLSLFALATYGLLIGLLATNRPGALNLPLELLNWVALAGLLPTCASIAGHSESLRRKLQARNEELAESLKRAEHIASHDDLTKLPNRAMFSQYLMQAVDRSRRENLRLALIFLDIDRFKAVNDVLGHDMGDAVLVEVARRLRGALPDGELLARLGGDEFVILVEGFVGRRRLEGITCRLLAAMAEPVTIGSQTYRVSISAGISLFPNDAKDVRTLMSHADLAMYRAKELGRNNVQFFSERLRGDKGERLGLESDLQWAIERGEFVLHYQPKVALTGGRLAGMEALVRWNHPRLGLLAPDRFIPLAEETGMIIPLGEWVLREACRRTAEWRRAGFSDLRVAVNLSVRQLHFTGLIAMVKAALRDAALDPGGLELEVTESIVVHDPEQAACQLKALRALGVTLAIDDFGTGYSSLSYLKQLPFDHVKLDRSFVRQLPDDAGDAAITCAVIAMAHSLRLKVIAEGVETEAQRRFLMLHRCDQMQGYLLSPPVSRDRFDKLLQALRVVPSEQVRVEAPATCR